MLGMNDVIEKVLNEENEEGSVRDAIARALAAKAAGGDVNAVKFLRELSEDSEGDKKVDIRVSVIK